MYSHWLGEKIWCFELKLFIIDYFQPIIITKSQLRREYAKKESVTPTMFAQ